MKVGLVQLCSQKGDIADNLVRIERHIADVASQGVEVVVFPEMSISGYLDPGRWPDAVLDREDPAIHQFSAMTRESGMTAIAGFVERNPGGKPFITQVVTSGGVISGFHRKQTVVDEEAEWFAPGHGGPLFNHGDVPFALAICADIDAPEVFRHGARAGARVIFEVAAPGLCGEQETRDWSASYAWWRDTCHEQLGTYARELGVYIAVATQAGRTIDEDFPGGGFVFDPTGTCVTETPDWREQVVFVSIPDSRRGVTPCRSPSSSFLPSL